MQQVTAGHNRSAIANASPANAESSSEESRPVDRKEMSSYGNNTLLSTGNTVVKSKKD